MKIGDCFYRVDRSSDGKSHLQFVVVVAVLPSGSRVRWYVAKGKRISPEPLGVIDYMHDDDDDDWEVAGFTKAE